LLAASSASLAAVSVASDAVLAACTQYPTCSENQRRSSRVQETRYAHAGLHCDPRLQ
jgi:hypothetical protein